MKNASEADVLNMALFGMTAKQWRDKNPDKKGSIRDYASINRSSRYIIPSTMKTVYEAP